MLSSSPSASPQINFFDITNQLNPTHPLLALGRVLDWRSLESTFAPLYSTKGRATKPIWLMGGPLILK